MRILNFLRSLTSSDISVDKLPAIPNKRVCKHSKQKRKPLNFNKVMKRKRKLQRAARKRMRLFAK